jgi:hypothetical protein
MTRPAWNGDEFTREVLDGVEAVTPERKTNGSANGQSLKLTFYRDFGKVANKQWLVKGVLAANETSTWIGPPGSGKSALGTEIAVCYVHSPQWRGHRIKERGGVVYFAFERADLVKRRIEAHRLRDNLPPELPIAVVGQIIDLLNPDCVGVILATLKEAEKEFDGKVRIAIFDTYNKGIAIGGTASMAACGGVPGALSGGCPPFPTSNSLHSLTSCRVLLSCQQLHQQLGAREAAKSEAENCRQIP